MMRAPILALAGLLALAGSALANVPTTALTGEVTSGGKPLEAADVLVTSPALHHPRSTTTTRNGRWWIDALPPGRYQVTIGKEGFQTLSRQTVLELGRVARVDAAIEPSEDEETISSTAAALSVTETQPITTHFADAAIDRLPVRRDPRDLRRVAPLFFGGDPYDTVIDGVPAGITEWLGEEVVEQVTVARGAIPIEHDSRIGTATFVRLRSGSSPFLSLRDSVSSRSWNRPTGAAGKDGVGHFFEAAAGGPLLRDRVWAFAATWSGEDVRLTPVRRRGGAGKLSLQPAASHHAEVSWLSGGGSDDRHDQEIMSVHYIAVPDPLSNFQTVVSRSTFREPYRELPPVRGSTARDQIFARYSRHVGSPAGDHLLTVGGSSTDAGSTSGLERRSHALFASDRWSLGKWVLGLGARYEDDREAGGALRPRLAATYDLQANGRRALVARYAEYEANVQELTVGYAAALGSTGWFRTDLVRQRQAHGWLNGLMAEAAYRLFDRFELGANAAIADSALRDDRRANAWTNAMFPVGEHVLGLTLLQRYFDDGSGRHDFATDLGLRYDVPLRRLTVTTAVDIAGLLGSDDAREVRGWMRLRM